MSGAMSQNDSYSFCIKTMRPEVTAQIIHEVFEKNKIGVIERIDFVTKSTPLPEDSTKFYKMAFIHLKQWYISDDPDIYGNIDDFVICVQSGLRLEYDDHGHYFTLHENFNPNNSPSKADALIEQLKQTITQLTQEKNYYYNCCVTGQQKLNELSAINQQHVAYKNQ